MAGRGVRGVETFGELVQRLLEGRSAAAVPPTTEAGAALGGLARLFGPLVPREVAFVLAVPPSLPRIEIERYELDRAVTNLVCNALDVVEAGDRIEISARADDGQVVIGVYDTGPGIAPEYLSEVCEPFFTTKPGREGLGLAAVNWIVRRRGGTVRVTTRPDVPGTCVELSLRAA